ncbi:MAG: hypothetical protein EU548_03245 [Promethearchaeota archaeon]|nr:MAG: hypothetical protein EU548_03245 [Candidatus Lokiarchaeota archaeon]
MLKPYIALEPIDRDLIIILSTLNILFSIYYLWEAFRLEKIFSLEDHHVEAFGKRIGIVSCVFLVPYFLFFTLLFRDLHNLQEMMLYLILLMQTCLLGTIFKEVYDLVFLEESERKIELEKNRKLYIDTDEEPYLKKRKKITF